MKIPHILVNSANVLHILPILVNSAMLVNSASINMQYYEYFAYTNGDVTGVQGPLLGHRRQGGSKITFVDTLRKDTGLECVNEISGLMTNRCLWRTAIDSRTLQPP